MKVIHSVASLMPSYGGPARSVTSLCNNLANHIETVEVFTTLEKNDTERPLSMDSVKTHFVKGKNLKRLRIAWAPGYKKLLEERIKCLKPDIIHDHGMWLQTNHVVMKLAKSHEIPTIISPRGMVEPWALQHKAWKKRVAWRLYQKEDLGKATVLHATAPGEAKHLRALGLKQPIAVIPNGINLIETSTDNKDDKVERICLFIGRIYPVKGLLNLVEAWGKVKPEGWKVILAGPDESSHKAQVESLIKKRKLDDVISLIGPVEEAEKKRLFDKADLVILPSFSENFGIVVAEALNYGIPVITTKGTPWEELVKHNCGWWIEVGTDPLAEAIQEATSLDDTERIQMGKRGQKLVRTRYSWPALASQMHHVYKWILNGGAEPDCVKFI